MNLRTALHRRATIRASIRASYRDERALRRALAAAPTVESAHEIATLAGRH